MINIISSEIYKILKSKCFRVVITLLLIMNSMSLVYILKEVLIYKNPNILTTGISAYQVSYHSDGIIYIILIFVSFLITSEYSNGSIRQIASHGIERWKFVIGQYIAISFITTIIILVFGFVNLIIFTLAYELGNVDVNVFILMNVGLICIICTSVSIATFLSYLFKNVGIAIISSIVVLKGIDLIVKLFSLLFQNNSFELYSLTNMRKIIVNLNPLLDAVINCCFVLVLISISTIIGSCLLFSKRDIH